MAFRPVVRAGVLATSCFFLVGIFHPAVLLAQQTDRSEQHRLQGAPYAIYEGCGEQELPFSGRLINILNRDAKGIADETNCGIRKPQLFISSLRGSAARLSSASYGGCEHCPAQPDRPTARPAVIATAPVGSASEKESQMILTARDRALGILRDENACSAWFREQDPQAADVFATLNYQLDHKGQQFITETRSTLIRVAQPWVAKVLQAGGEYQTITLNRQGAFFRASAYVLIVPVEGGPALSRGALTLRVGPYIGGSQEAQLTTILHEFGHTIGLLEYDGDELAARSIHNTDLVLAHCEAQIAGANKRTRLAAAD